MRTPVRDLAQGRWRGILATVGIDAKTLSGKHVACPMCGGKDRFRFDDKEGRGTWICSRCGAGDGVSLVMARTGADFRSAAEQIEVLVGVVPRIEPKPERSDADKREALSLLWRSASPVKDGDPVSLWLRTRAGLVRAPECLRTHPWARYQGEPVSHHPAMVAMVADARGRPATLHRTFLTRDGRKAPVGEPRRLMPGHLPQGSAVRLFPPDALMGVAEGIETALAAASLFGLPVWAAINAVNLSEWAPPPDAREIVVFGDNDASCTGQAAAFALARRLISRGIVSRVEVPPGEGTDWNDVLLGKALAHGTAAGTSIGRQQTGRRDG